MWSQFSINVERNLKDLWRKNLLSLKPITVFKKQPKAKTKQREHVKNGYPLPRSPFSGPKHMSYISMSYVMDFHSMSVLLTSQ